MTKKLILLALLITFAHLHSQSQISDSTLVWRPGFYFSLPAQQLATSELNQVLTPAGYPELSPALMGVAAGFTNRQRDQNSYGATQLSFLSTLNDGNDGSTDARIYLWDISFIGHYDLIPDPKWLA